MNKILKRTLISLLVIALTLIVAFLSLNAVHAFSRHEISLTDSVYKSSDGATMVEFIDSACAISRDGAREAYNAVIVDNNIIKLSSADNDVFMLVIDDCTIFIEQYDLYIYRYMGDINGSNK